ncbi:MAG: DUF1326 domain-containing protein [Acidimicrobiia bacterium]|nr:DUF1326 domain-containing protein [Acidimicrobiia bacterium]
MNATIIEACSCPMFCQCYFNTKPAAHHHGAASSHYCKFNMAYKVNKGSHGAVNLDGMKFWIAGDLGDNFGDGTTDWAELTFEPSAGKQQRDAIAQILGKVYPVKWGSFTVSNDGKIDWSHQGTKAVARLDAGKSGEIVLNQFSGMSAKPVVIHNLKYFAVPRNEGFVLMPNEVEAYRKGAKKFEFRGTNGFMITYDISSKDVN